MAVDVEGKAPADLEEADTVRDGERDALIAGEKRQLERAKGLSDPEKANFLGEKMSGPNMLGSKELAEIVGGDKPTYQFVKDRQERDEEQLARVKKAIEEDELFKKPHSEWTWQDSAKASAVMDKRKKEWEASQAAKATSQDVQKPKPGFLSRIKGWLGFGKKD